MNFQLKKYLLTKSQFKLINCPHCGEGIFWASGEIEMCVFCYGSLPSSTSITSLIETRIDLYNGGLEDACYGIFDSY